MNNIKITATVIKSLKGKEPILSLTAYDYPTALLLGKAGIHIVHVGDSLGMVMLGYPDTTLVTMEEIIHHTRAVARSKINSLISADMPYKSYDTVEDAVRNSKKLIQAGAEAVKIEGGRNIIPQIKAVI
ncbi:MAG TPA: 3-methyl-2-oxobutanoate hydroxymethyltransferase, partial [Verrucomicrobiota bacterium]|nr:3-methyl-2-oxobutanoate hydroxymethyltransferase [Verrucomicrobiota bacterium]